MELAPVLGKFFRKVCIGIVVKWLVRKIKVEYSRRGAVEVKWYV